MTADDPHVTPKHLYRYELCLASSSPFECMEGMSKLKMPAMGCAVTKVSGDLRKAATAWDYICRTWLINSAYEPERAPALEVFLGKGRRDGLVALVNWNYACPFGYENPGGSNTRQ